MSDDIRALIAEGIDDEPVGEYADKGLWAAVCRQGSELWLDSGDIDDIDGLWCTGFSALTTNNSLLNAEVQKGVYDELIERIDRVLPDDLSDRRRILEAAFILNAHHALRLVRHFGAHVSVELHTDLAHDIEGSVDYGRRYHALSPDRFYVKVPLTPSGLVAARRLGQEGIPVNFTLGFGARQNVLIARFAQPAFVNVFLGRLNSFVADNGLGDGRNVGEKAALASNEAVGELRRTHGLGTRQIAASMRSGEQVVTLTGIDVLTMPTKVAREFEELSPAEKELTPRDSGDLPVEIGPELTPDAADVAVLWRVDEAMREAVDDLMAGDPDAVTDEDIVDHFQARGLGGLFPEWSKEDANQATDEGKIPHYPAWRDRLASGEVALDALMNLAALQRFAADQKAMDNRIRDRLGAASG